jgi:hypothetical protein
MKDNWKLVRFFWYLPMIRLVVVHVQDKHLHVEMRLSMYRVLRYFQRIIQVFYVL